VSFEQERLRLVAGHVLAWEITVFHDFGNLSRTLGAKNLNDVLLGDVPQRLLGQGNPAVIEALHHITIRINADVLPGRTRSSIVNHLLFRHGPTPIVGAEVLV
jgi:hypothetical protein